MTLQKISQWLVTFSLLTAFTVHSGAALGGQTVERAYAKAIESDMSFSSYVHVLVMEPRDVAHGVLGRMIERLTRRVEREREFCGLTQSQWQVLGTHFTVEKHGKGWIIRGKHGGKEPGKQEIERALKKAGLPAISCKTFQIYEHILLLLTAHVS